MNTDESQVPPIPSKVPDLRGVPWGELPRSEDKGPEFSSAI